MRLIQTVTTVAGRSRRRRLALSLACAALLLLALVVFLFAPPLPAELTLARADLRLAAWLGVSWSSTPSDPASLPQLAAELNALQVDDVYVYVSYLKPDGVFNQTYDFAPAFVAALKREAPALRVLAWIGLPVSLEGGLHVNQLHSAGTRRAIAEFSRFAVAELGFDGLHINAELIADGNTALLEILAAIREAMPSGAILSATAHPLRLEERATAMPYPAVAHHWSAAYFRRVAQHVDQIALMAYDSGLVFPRDYLNWTRFQVQRSQEALKDLSTELFIGASVSEEWTISHQTQAETLSIFLAGVQAGLAERLDGIALYPYWELDQPEKALIARSLDH